MVDYWNDELWIVGILEYWNDGMRESMKMDYLLMRVIEFLVGQALIEFTTNSLLRRLPVEEVRVIQVVRFLVTVGKNHENSR